MKKLVDKGPRNYDRAARAFNWIGIGGAALWFAGSCDLMISPSVAADSERAHAHAARNDLTRAVLAASGSVLVRTTNEVNVPFGVAITPDTYAVPGATVDATKASHQLILARDELQGTAKNQDAYQAVEKLIQDGSVNPVAIVHSENMVNTDIVTGDMMGAGRFFGGEAALIGITALGFTGGVLLRRRPEE